RRASLLGCSHATTIPFNRPSRSNRNHEHWINPRKGNPMRQNKNIDRIPPPSDPKGPLRLAAATSNRLSRLWSTLYPNCNYLQCEFKLFFARQRSLAIAAVDVRPLQTGFRRGIRPVASPPHRAHRQRGKH